MFEKLSSEYSLDKVILSDLKTKKNLKSVIFQHKISDLEDSYEQKQVRYFKIQFVKFNLKLISKTPCLTLLVTILTV